MWRWFLPQGWTPDRRTVALVVFGFSAVSAVGGLFLVSNQLSVLFNQPLDSVTPTFAIPVPFPASQRVEAGASLAGSFAAACAALGGFALYARANWGTVVAAAALAVEAVARIIITTTLPVGTHIATDVLSVLWTVALILLVIGFRLRLPTRGPSVTPITGSWMEDLPTEP